MRHADHRSPLMIQLTPLIAMSIHFALDLLFCKHRIDNFNTSPRFSRDFWCLLQRLLSINQGDLLTKDSLINYLRRVIHQQRLFFERGGGYLSRKRHQRYSCVQKRTSDLCRCQDKKKGCRGKQLKSTLYLSANRYLLVVKHRVARNRSRT